MTGALDRLERAGYVERRADPTDRRRTRLRPTAKAGEQAALLFVPQLRELGEAYARYSAADLQTITEFLERTHQLIWEQTQRLMAPPSA
jgi:DNA-binding MarR family transcriptional regulator